MRDIKELRKEKKISPPQMANKLGIALSTYFDKEAGRRRFQPHEIVQICTLFNERVENIKNFSRKNTQKADISSRTPEKQIHNEGEQS